MTSDKINKVIQVSITTEESQFSLSNLPLGFQQPHPHIDLVLPSFLINNFQLLSLHPVEKIEIFLSFLIGVSGLEEEISHQQGHSHRQLTKTRS